MEEVDKKEKYFLSTSWAQTLFTVTPREDVENVMLKHKDVELREIKSTSKISANVEDFFEKDMSEEEFVFRSPLLIKHLINVKELEQESTRDAENQTFLQGVPIVGIPIEYKHEASQTMYMSSPCPPAKYFEHISNQMSSLEIKLNLKFRFFSVSISTSPMPVFKNNYSSQTMITIAPGKSQHEAVNYLSRTYENDEKNLYSRNIIDDEETIILEVLNFLLSRAFWISDPVQDQISVETTCQETQTALRYNRNTDSIVLDNETQTKLTCKPKHSNSKLLAEYEETRSFVQSCLQECFRRIGSRIIIDDLIDEIIVKGANRLKYPMTDRLIQTVASYKSPDLTEEDVLRKLKIPVIIDPFEASIVVLPLMDYLLRSTCDKISRDAQSIVKNILNSLVQQTVSIAFKIRKQPDSIEQKLDRRRKKIVESMLKKATKTVATQTGLAGVPEVARIKESKEILCSVCARESICHWCVAAQKEEDLPVPSTKLLRTQDILLSYNPCYVVATASERAKNPHLQPACLMTREIERLTTTQSSSSLVTPEETGDVVNKAINVLMTPKKDIQTRDSISEWTRIIDSTLAKSWSLKESASNTTTVSIAIRALQILKSTFCTRDNLNDEYIACNVDDCTLLNLDQRCRRSINNSQICARPRVDKFRATPTRPLSEFRGQI
ncbi:uncharacterized protein LOC114930624 [Nylanderia fulva]|uniref:uncharacterized protein LOC114930624 n=1 Tax=Nylanderia fulva TaxID=613905 RepID=UPI0010FB9C46|nr:uncharacterized protein LOC114930624 [Nylanderia fulva]